MKKISKILSIIISMGVIVMFVMAFFIRTVDLETGIVYDGLGRTLSEPPLWASLFVTSEHSWAGLGWHFFDIIWFFGGICTAFNLYEWSQDN